MDECKLDDGLHLTLDQYTELCNHVDDHITKNFMEGFKKYDGIQICYNQFVTTILTVLIRHIIRTCDTAAKNTGGVSQDILIDVIRNICEIGGLRADYSKVMPSSQTIN